MYTSKKSTKSSFILIIDNLNVNLLVDMLKNRFGSGRELNDGIHKHEHSFSGMIHHCARQKEKQQEKNII